MSHVTRNEVRFCVCQVYLHMARATCLVLRRATVCQQLTELFTKQTNTQSFNPAVYSSSLIGTSLQFTTLSHISQKFKAQSRTVFTVSSVDTGSSGDGTQRELRLRENYMRSENEYIFQLQEELNNGTVWLSLFHQHSEGPVKSSCCSASPPTVLRTGYHDGASVLSTQESGIEFRNSTSRKLHIRA